MLPLYVPINVLATLITGCLLRDFQHAPSWLHYMGFDSTTDKVISKVLYKEKRVVAWRIEDGLVYIAHSLATLRSICMRIVDDISPRKKAQSP